MTKLHDLYEQQGQSPWLDNLRRDYVRGGRLAALIDEGIRGVTSNPTIFAKAIEAGNDYDEQFGELLATHTVEEAYWELVVTDIEERFARNALPVALIEDVMWLKFCRFRTRIISIN